MSTALAEALSPHGYVAGSIPDRFELQQFGSWSVASSGTIVIETKGAWVRKTFRKNHAVVHLGAPDSEQSLNELSHRMEVVLADPLGYTYWLKPVSISLVWSGDGLWDRTRKLGKGLEFANESELDPAMLLHGPLFSKKSNSGSPRANLMSISVVDLAAKRVSHEPHPRLTSTKATAETIRMSLTGLVASPTPDPAVT